MLRVLSAGAALNAEVYLRMLGERDLLDAERAGVSHVRAHLLEAASALVSCDVVDVTLAEAVLAAYGRALALHSPLSDPRRVNHWTTPASVAVTEPLAPRSVVAPDILFESRRGLGLLHLRWIAVAPGQVDLRVSATADTAYAPPEDGVPALEIGLPDGSGVVADFCGDWRLQEQSGVFRTSITLPPGLPWLTVDGLRVSLQGSPAPAVSVEQLEVPNAAVAHLWQLLADFSRPTVDVDALESAVAALRTAGALRADALGVRALLWVAHHALGTPTPAADSEPRSPASTALGRRSQDAAWPAGEPPAGTPREWRGLLKTRAGAFSGPKLELGIGAVTPVFDGICVAIDTLRSRSHGFSLEVDIAGVPIAPPASALLGRDPLAFWALDDRGNAYLGHAGRHSEDLERHGAGRASVDFPALDPRARQLTLMPTRARARALVRIAL